MSEAHQGQVGCPHCGKLYRWKPEIADRKVRCKCGRKLRMPASPTGKASLIDVPGDSPAENQPGGHRSPLQSSGGAIYELDVPEDGDQDTAAPRSAPRADAKAAQSRCPSCNRPLKPGAVICINCGFNVAAGQQLQTKIGAEEIAADEAGSPAIAAEASRETADGEKTAPAQTIKLAIALAAFLVTAALLLYFFVL